MTTGGTTTLVRALSLPIALMVLAGCAQTPDYRRPDQLLPTNWNEAPAQMQSGGVNPADIEWRQFFHDPRLQALIARALEENHDLRIALTRVAEARAQLDVVRADRLPTVNAGLTQSVTTYPPWMTNTVTPVTAQRNDLSLSAISYEVDFWGRVGSLSEAAQASYLASEEAGRALRIALIAEVANAYFGKLEIEERLAITRESIETRTKTRDLMRRGMALGAAARSDVLITESQLDSARAELAILENQRAATEHALTLLTGKAATDLPAGKRLIEQDLRNDLAPGIPSEVLFSRPDVLAAEYRLKETQANIKAARAAFLPRILLTASLGLASKSLAGLFAGGTETWSYTPTLTLPLFDNGRNAGLLDIATARKDLAVADYEKTIQQAFREVADLLAARTALAAQLQATEAALLAHRERLVVAEARYRGGSINYLEVLDTQRDVLAMKQSAIQVRRQQLSTTAQLYKALGGGKNFDTKKRQNGEGAS